MDKIKQIRNGAERLSDQLHEESRGFDERIEALREAASNRTGFFLSSWT